MLYALIGFILPLFRKCKDRTLIIWAVALILSPVLIDVVNIFLKSNPGSFIKSIGEQIDKANTVPVNDSISLYLYPPNGGWEEWRKWQDAGIFYRYAYILESNRIPKVLGMFLFGLYAGRKMIYANLEAYKPLLKKLRKWGFIIGIPMSLAMAAFEIDNRKIPNPWGIADTVSYALGVVPLCLAYASVICLYWIKRKGNTKWKYLAPMGRMALTNYLMQTILGIFIYYGVGLGLGGQLGTTIFFPAGIAVYFIQVAYSNYWFHYFYYGPMEWLWRMLTYGKRLKFRKPTGQGA
jgi:uncharacterized protein